MQSLAFKRKNSLLRFGWSLYWKWKGVECCFAFPVSWILFFKAKEKKQKLKFSNEKNWEEKEGDATYTYLKAYMLHTSPLTTCREERRLMSGDEDEDHVILFAGTDSGTRVTHGVANFLFLYHVSQTEETWQTDSQSRKNRSLVTIIVHPFLSTASSLLTSKRGILIVSSIREEYVTHASMQPNTTNESRSRLEAEVSVCLPCFQTHTFIPPMCMMFSKITFSKKKVILSELLRVSCWKWTHVEHNYDFEWLPHMWMRREGHI